MRSYELRDPWSDVAAETRTIEQAIMPNAGLLVVLTHVVGKMRRHAVGGAGLPNARDVVALALDGQQRGAPDGGDIDRAPA